MGATIGTETGRVTRVTPDWDQLSRLPGLRSVVDPADAEGSKSRLIDRVHKRVLGAELHRASGPVLDFGCGMGRLSGWLAAHGYEVVGVDSSEAMLEAARRNTPDVAFRLSDGAVIPGDAATFGVIVSVGVLQYMVGTETYVPILSELGRVVRRDGTLLAIEHVGDRDVLGRGGQLEEYAHGLFEAGWVISCAYPVRRSDSRSFTEAIRQPRLANLPGLERIVTLDARMRPKPLAGGSYADYLFVARRRSAARDR